MATSSATLNLTVGFMIWVILSSLLPFIKEDIHIPADQLAWVTALPVVLGSILRVPIGYYTNLFGARKIFMISFILCIFPVYYISIANSVTDLLIGGLFLGVGGPYFRLVSPPCQSITRKIVMDLLMEFMVRETLGQRFQHLLHPLLRQSLVGKQRFNCTWLY